MEPSDPSVPQSPLSVPPGGWLRTLREQRAVSQSELAGRFGCTRQAWAQFEASEARGAISLSSLRRAADALGYDFAYSLVPREGRRSEPVSGAAASSADLAGAPAAVEPVQDQAAFSPEPELPTELL